MNQEANQPEPTAMLQDLQEVGLHDSVDGFQLEEVISERPFNTLYRVTHPEHDLPMIMKVPRLSASIPASAFTAFETEVRILSRLHGAYTPNVIASGDLSSCPYLVLEYIEGDRLQEAVRQAPLNTESIVEVMAPVCKAVHELHRHNVIHLDLKPGNIRNRASGRAVVLDFGTAHHAYMPDMYANPRKQAPRSFAYVAPEQLQGIRNDSRSDIFALGVILYQLATGKLPFGKGDHISVSKRLYLLPSPPRAINAAIPPWLQEVILKCLERQPQERYTTAKQLAYALVHPHMVPLTERAQRLRNPGITQQFRAWLKARYARYTPSSQHPHERISRVPHALVALDLDHTPEDLKLAMYNAIRRLAQSERLSFFTILTVVKENELAGKVDFSDLLKREQPRYMRRHMELRQWMKPLRLASNRINYQVLEGDPADEIIAYARYHVVDNIVIGTISRSRLARFMGSVSSRVVAEAPCTVTVVRSRRD